MRITYATDIVPRGIYKPNDENCINILATILLTYLAKIIEFEEEFSFPATEDLKSLENWVHIHPNILKAGRIEHV